MFKRCYSIMITRFYFKCACNSGNEKYPDFITSMNELDFEEDDALYDENVTEEIEVDFDGMMSKTRTSMILRGS